MPSLYRVVRSSQGRNTVARIALALVVLCGPGIFRVSAAQAQSDITFGRFENPETTLSASGIGAGIEHLFVASWFHDPIGTMVRWIIETAVEPRPQVIPEGVVLFVIPGHTSYRYAVIGGQRFVVDAATRAVVYVVD